MKKCFLHAESRKNKTVSKQKTLDYKSTPKMENKNVGRRINVERIDPEKVHEMRMRFNQDHFGCGTFHHTDGKESWKKPETVKTRKVLSVKRIMQIIVPSEFYFVTDRTREKKVYSRDVHHRVTSVTTKEMFITTHAENAVKEMLLVAGVDKDSIMVSKNVCYVTLHKQVSEEKIREIFPTLNIRVYKVIR